MATIIIGAAILELFLMVKSSLLNLTLLLLVVGMERNTKNIVNFLQWMEVVKRKTIQTIVLE